jgi:glutathione reductase (NADPH)
MWLSHKEAVKRGYNVIIYESHFKPLKNLITKSESKTFIKLVVDKTSDVVLGVHMFGDDTPEIIQAASIALTCRATKKQFDVTVAIHPTAAEELVTIN